MTMFVPQPQPTFRRYRRYVSETPDRLECRVCGFPLNRADVEPGGGFPTAYVTTGNTYVWTSPADALTVIDKQIEPVTNPAVSCSFCGSSRLFDGQKGQGQ